jgi:HPt (histidine-containing phosphotransfer) domain-containing protein
MKLCNLDYLKSFTPNDNAFAIQVLELFLKETPATIDKMKRSLAASDWVELYKEAHGVKPSVELAGVPESVLEALMKIIAYSKSTTDTDQIPALLQYFEESMQRIYAELETAIAEMKAEPKG